MKNIIQKSFVIALLYYATVLVGCINQCNCGPVKNSKFKYTELKATNLAFAITGDSLFSEGISTADTIAKEQFGIRCEFLYELIAQTQQCHSLNFINEAYACDCAFPTYKNSDAIVDISIITLNDLDATHLAGSKVNDYFKTLDYTYSPQKIRYNDVLFNRSSYYNEIYGGNGYPVTDMYLVKPMSKTVAFELVVKYASAKTMIAKTKPVFLK